MVDSDGEFHIKNVTPESTFQHSDLLGKIPCTLCLWARNKISAQMVMVSENCQPLKMKMLFQPYL